ncbi:MAG: hypothetical protein A2126_01755 [Candidatus Woykebacteria bacterium GWB1_45_5]|uniref:GtrA/DPMS transmembrane domain-containing protein n=2 Tax=Candidatus Woykeibacteriota TaxID=1817899 RepID=A0A1G1W1X7_9BACT|nr:MAG: hypothetical protein A2113_03985 [Candidatus Woykebacteria bacterium GWA1_44_8]OGY23023.1 MAG: hypothetical protein A2126_01755 [Candidatus Woykebacteria bacterium GWB1_45_5]
MIKTLGLKTYYFINRNEQLRQPLTYLIIGGTCAVLDIIILYILVEFLKIWYLLAAAIAFILIVTLGFFLQKRFTFRHKGGKNELRYLVFLFITGSGVVWEISFLYIFVEFLNLWYLEAAVITKFIVFSWNFLMNKYITFRRGWV